MSDIKEASKDWFSEWFDSKYYHILYKNRDFKEAEKFLNNLVHKLEIDKNTKILDLACGKGRHSVYLNSLGFDVVGLDLAANSIEEANKSKSDGLSFDTHDMRNEIPYGPYDLVLNAFTSFGYFSNPKDDVKTLNNVHQSLTDEGIFVFDFLNVDYVEQHLVASEVKEIDGVVFNLDRQIKDGSIVKDITFNADDKEYKFQERVDALKYHRFIEYFKEVGFDIIHQFGDYDLNLYDKMNSKRLILIAKKIK